MKKIVLSVLVMGAFVFTSCKSEKKDVTKEVEKVVVETKKEVNKKVEEIEEVVEETKKDIQSALDGISIPNFENAEVTKHLESYATYAKDYIAAKGDVLKNAKLAKQGVALAAKGKELLGSLDAESAKKFKSVMNAIQSKMAPSK